jgi:thiosulfate dehydrogenase
MQIRSQKLFTVTNLLIAGLFLVLIFIAAIPARTAYSQSDPPGDMLRGGRLYAAWDNLASDGLPEEIHLLWPENIAGEFPARITWRCVNCHGWDYLGSESKSFLTATRAMEYPNLFSMIAKSEEEILPLLNGETIPNHDFSTYLNEQDLRDLSAFLSSGLTLPKLIADWETFQVQGTVEVGQQNFQEFCSFCHGLEGEKINLNTDQTPIFLGDLAWSNPWRIAHIIRFGHHQTRVPPAELLGLSFSQQIDILAFTQTLPNALEIVAPEFQAVDFDLQASTVPLMFGALSIGALILIAAWVTLKRKN